MNSEIKAVPRLSSRAGRKRLLAAALAVVFIAQAFNGLRFYPSSRLLVVLLFALGGVLIVTVLVGVARDLRLRPQSTWGLAVLTGVILGLPFGWLMSYLAFHYLGLFFFALGGMLIGGLTFRVAREVRPLPKTWLRWGTVIMVASCWATSVMIEARGFPDLVSEWALDKERVLPEGLSRESFLATRRADVERSLREVAWPGGVLGYIRWTVTSSRLEVLASESAARVFVAGQYRGWWVARVILSIALLGFGIYSQVTTLAVVGKNRDRISKSATITEPPTPEPEPATFGEGSAS